MKNISRKDFLKGVTFSAAGIAAASLLSGCSNQNDKNNDIPGKEETPNADYIDL